jgi:hypothetical protein
MKAEMKGAGAEKAAEAAVTSRLRDRPAAKNAVPDGTPTIRVIKGGYKLSGAYHAVGDAPMVLTVTPELVRSPPRCAPNSRTPMRPSK